MALLQKAYLGATPLFRNVPWFYQNAPVLVRLLDGGAKTVTASATPHAKGAWTQLVASTSGAANLLSFVVTCNANATDTATLLDVGIGAAGSETVIIPDIAVGGTLQMPIQVPVKIPSGTRIAFRAQSAVASRAVTLLAGSYLADYSNDAALIPTSVDVLGVDTATSTGTAMSGSSGTWVQIVASTTKDYIAFDVVPSVTDTDTASGAITYELGVGAAGSEQTIGQITARTTISEQIVGRPNMVVLFGREVPSGSRLAIKHDIAADPAKYDACIIAIPKV